MKRMGGLLCMICLICLFAACIPDAIRFMIIGTWRMDFIYVIDYTFAVDNTFLIIDDQPDSVPQTGTYMIDGNLLTFHYSDGTEESVYLQIQGDVMTFTPITGGFSLSLVRQ